MKKPFQSRTVGRLSSRDTQWTARLLQNTGEQKESADADDIVALDETIKGILPLEIYKLVERRREVKKLIKEKKNLTDEQLVQVTFLQTSVDRNVHLSRLRFSMTFVRKLTN